MRADGLITENGRHLLGRKKPGEEIGDEFRRTWCQLGRLQHHAIARSKRCGEWDDRQLERIIPRADHADDANRLIEKSAPVLAAVRGRPQHASVSSIVPSAAGNSELLRMSVNTSASRVSCRERLPKSAEITSAMRSAEILDRLPQLGKVGAPSL